MPDSTTQVGRTEGELGDIELDAVCAGKEPSNLPEFSKMNRIRTRALDEISIHLTDT